MNAHTFGKIKSLRGNSGVNTSLISRTQPRPKKSRRQYRGYFSQAASFRNVLHLSTSLFV
jgi:hypothetical protein